MRCGDKVVTENTLFYTKKYQWKVVDYSPVSDCWSTLEVVLEESDEEIDLLRFLTKQVFPEEENFFLKQMGKKLNCAKDK